MNLIYLFGLQRSGTNYTRALLQLNLDVNCSNPRAAWQHIIKVPSHKILKDTPIIIIHKNPFKWVESLANRDKVDWHKRTSRYTNSKYTDSNIFIGKNKLNIGNLTNGYKDFYSNWIINMPTYIQDTSTLIKYEDLLDNNKRGCILENIKDRYNFKKLNSKWLNISLGHVRQSENFDNTRLQYYKDENQFDILKQEHINYIKNKLGKSFIEKIGYKYNINI